MSDLPPAPVEFGEFVCTCGGEELLHAPATTKSATTKIAPSTRVRTHIWIVLPESVANDFPDPREGYDTRAPAGSPSEVTYGVERVEPRRAPRGDDRGD